MSTENMNTYEIGYHLIPTLQEENIAKAISEIRDAIVSNGGTITKEEAPKFRRLAYEMRKKIDAKYETYDSAHFGYIIFDAEPEAIAKIKEIVDLIVAVLRYLIVKDPVLERIEGIDDMEDEQAVEPTEESADSEVTEVSDDANAEADVSEADLDRSLDKIVGEEGESSSEETVK